MMEKTAKDDKVLKMIRVVGDRQFTQSRNTGQRVGQLMTKDLRIAIKLIDINYTLILNNPVVTTLHHRV